MRHYSLKSRQCNSPQLIGTVKLLPFTEKTCAVLPRKEMAREDYDSEARGIFVSFQKENRDIVGSKAIPFPRRRSHGADFCACRFNGSVASQRCNSTLKNSDLRAWEFHPCTRLHIKQFKSVPKKIRTIHAFLTRSEWFPVKLASYKRKGILSVASEPEHSTERSIERLMTSSDGSTRLESLAATCTSLFLFRRKKPAVCFLADHSFLPSPCRHQRRL
jgi:hypothetical protein